MRTEGLGDFKISKDTSM